MLNFLLIDDSFPVNSRNQKIIDSLEKHYGNTANISVITWDRNSDYKEEQDNYYVYQKDSAYGNKTRKLLNLWGYRRFCHHTIKQLHPDVVIASHWNNLMMVPRLDSKKQMLIYENLDVPTEAYILRKITSFIEHWCMRYVNLTIHASRFFTKLYSPQINQLVLENKPVFQAPQSNEYVLHTPIRLSFIGLLRYREILKLLIDAVRKDLRYELYFHGDGHARAFLEEYTGQEPNIFFTGRYNHDEIAKLYEQTDVVWAAYPNKDFNVKYAISNKFHESIAFGKPTVYANKTFLGDYVKEQHIGMEVDPYSIEDIKRLLNEIATHTDDLKKISSDMQVFYSKQTSWDDDFENVIKNIDTFHHINQNEFYQS